MTCSDLWGLPKEKIYISPTQNVAREMTTLYSVQERYPTAHPGSDFRVEKQMQHFQFSRNFLGAD